MTQCPWPSNSNTSLCFQEPGNFKSIDTFPLIFLCLPLCLPLPQTALLKQMKLLPHLPFFSASQCGSRHCGIFSFLYGILWICGMCDISEFWFKSKYCPNHVVSAFSLPP